MTVRTKRNITSTCLTLFEMDACNTENAAAIPLVYDHKRGICLQLDYNCIKKIKIKTNKNK